jgi:hypothetical protein
MQLHQPKSRLNAAKALSAEMTAAEFGGPRLVIAYKQPFLATFQEYMYAKQESSSRRQRQPNSNVPAENCNGANGDQESISENPADGDASSFSLNRQAQSRDRRIRGDRYQRPPPMAHVRVY